MATENTFESYIGIGKVSALKAGANQILRPVGNVSQLNISTELDVQRQRDFTRPGGGTLKKVERVQQVNLAMTWLSFNTGNWELATGGTSSDVESDTIDDETVKCHKGSTAVLAHPPRSITSVTNAAGTTTYVAGTDYEMSAAGVFFPETSTITEASDVEVTYVSADYTEIEAGTTTSQIVYLLFEGLNEAETNLPVIVEFWRTSIPSASEIALIGESFGEQQYPAEVLKDPSKGVGKSAYYRVRHVNPPAA